MTIEQRSSSGRPPRTFARVLSFLLLAFIFYGTTVEAAHKHVTVVEPANTSNSTVISDSSQGSELTAKLAGCGECLICQLHQHSSASLTSERDAEALQQIRLGVFEPQAQSVSNGVVRPRQGRAPPLAIQ